MSTFELAESLDVSISTIRRDLNLLEEKNEIIRNYGYCSYNYKNQTDFDQSGPERIKQAIAREASKYISDYDTLFINSSSTALKTLDFLQSNHLTVVTNNVKINYSPHKDNCSYILTGGEMRFPKRSTGGRYRIKYDFFNQCRHLYHWLQRSRCRTWGHNENIE